MFAELVAWLLACLILCACFPGRMPALTQWRLAPSSFASGGSQKAVRPLPPIQEKLTRDRYVFDVVFDYRQHRLEVEQQITYTNRYSGPLDDLVLVVEPNRYTEAFDLHTVTLDDEATPPANWTLREALLTIPLPTTLQPGDTAHLRLSYTLRLPARAGYFGFTQRQTNLGDWHPFIPPLAANGSWLVHQPAAVGEHLAYSQADYRLAISGPGLERLQIAAPAPAIKTATGWRYTLDGARNFAWSASPDYRMGTRTVNGITVAAWWFAEHSLAGEESLNATAQALELYSDLFAPYPHRQLASVEADFADGMEFDGLYFLGQEYYAPYRGEPNGYLTALSAHETAHQWWYALVGNDPALEPFLDEALATYSELIFYEQYYPQLVDWWWQYRVQRFAPTGCVNSTIYDHRGFRSYVNAVYLHGVQMLHDLRTAMGDEQFARFLRDYAAANRGALADQAAFRRSLRNHFAGDPGALLQGYCLEDRVASP